jgi:ABC-type antimicrobial peptide transport system permease subunit
MRLALIGVALGLAGAWWLTRFLRTLLYEVRPFEPVTFALVAFGLAAMALVACAVPALRATRTDPNVVLRSE